MSPKALSPSFEVTGVNTMDWPRYFSPSTNLEAGQNCADSGSLGSSAL
jgi:hypothetical protein